MRSAESLVVYYHFTVFSNHSEGTHNDQTLHLSNQPLQGTLLTPFTPPSVSLINTSDDTAKDQAIFFHSLLPTRSVLFFTALSLHHFLTLSQTCSLRTCLHTCTHARSSTDADTSPQTGEAREEWFLRMQLFHAQQANQLVYPLCQRLVGQKCQTSNIFQFTF